MISRGGNMRENRFRILNGRRGAERFCIPYLGRRAGAHNRRSEGTGGPRGRRWALRFGNGLSFRLGHIMMEKEGRVDGLKNTESKTLISAPSVRIHCSFVDKTVVNSIFYDYTVNHICCRYRPAKNRRMDLGRIRKHIERRYHD